jgi:hypothetical protein
MIDRTLLQISKRTAYALAFIFSFSGGAWADGFSAMVVDIDSGLVLTADQIDAARKPDMMARLTTIAMGIQDIADGELDPDEILQISSTASMRSREAIQATALGGTGYRAPMTALSARIGHNARLLSERLSALGAKVGNRASSVEVVRSTDGGPGFAGYTTVRDTVRVATSLLRGHAEATNEVFEPATGGMKIARIWLSEGDACLLAVEGPRSGRTLVASMTGAPNAAECFNKSAQLLSEADVRISQIQ